MASLESLLLLNDIEVVNSLRALTYLRRGLGGPQFQASLRRPLIAEAGYRDDYVDTYDADPFWPGNLACYCPLLDSGPYVSPAIDPAPWYDASRPESGDFLGIVADIEVSPSAVRAVSPRSSGGASVGAAHLRQRIVSVTAQAYASSLAGAAWGEAWLREVLAGSGDGCAADELTIVPTCPPEGVATPDTYLRTLREVGLVDGPVPGAIQDVGACHAQVISFQLAAGDPHLLLPPVTCLPATWLRVDPFPCCSMVGPATLGDSAAKISVHAGLVGSPLADVTITAAVSDSCPTAAVPFATYPITVPVGCVLVIDASNRTVTLTRSTTGEVIAGPDAIDHEGLLPWVLAKAGEQVCICVDAGDASPNAGSIIKVETIGREL